MTIYRLVALAKLCIRGHVLNWFWRSHDKRRQVRLDVLLDVVEPYFKHFLSTVKSVPETDVVQNDAGEKIFSIWLQGEENAPDLVRACFRSVRRHCSQELVVLDEKTIFDWIELPEKIIQKYRDGKIGRAHFADICRVELLYRYGGFWLDSTGFVTAPIPDWIVEQDFFVFLTGTKYGSPYSFMQNCFIRARKGAYLLAAWRAMMLDYWMHENHTFDYFMHQLLFKTLVKNDERAKKYFEKMPHVSQDPTHELWDSVQLPYDARKFSELTGGAFFQKLTYRGTDKIESGTMLYEMVYKMGV